MSNFFENAIYVSLFVVASAIFFYGIYLKKQVSNATDDIKADERYELFVKRSSYMTNFGLLFLFSIIAALFLPIQIALVSFSILVLYILAYSTHVTMGIPYDRIIKIGIISVGIVLMSILLIHNFG